MARNFDGTDDVLVVSAGGMSGIDGGPVTLAFILKHNDVVRGSVINLRTSAGALVAQINADGGNWFFETTAGFQNMGTASTSDNWHLFGVTKATGTATPRSHKYVYDTNTASHADAGNTNGDSSAAVGASGTCQFGRYQGTGEYRNMELAVAGVWDRVLTDTEFEQLAFSLAHWHAAAPVAVWVFDQSAVGQTVVDLTGGGANQSSVTGTAVSTVSVPVFGYGAEIVALSSSAAAAGATNANAECASATGAAEDATAAVSPGSEAAATTAAAGDATASVAPVSEVATAAAAAADATTLVAPSVDSAAATGSAGDASASITVSAECATASAAAEDATVITGTLANAECATAAAVAEDATAAIAAAAEACAAAAAALDAARAVVAAAEAALATAAAEDGSASLGASAEVATGTGTGHDATTLASVGVEHAAATAAAYDATVQIPVSGGGQIHGPLPAMPGSAAPTSTASVPGAIT